jgi:molybdenum cofactor synthesis domain-containing protein
MKTTYKSMLEEVKVEDAVGMILSHDLTQIIPGQFKGRLFKKGHKIQDADIPALLRIGKEHIYVMKLQPGFIHEDEASMRIARAVSGQHISLTEVNEGKVNVQSTILGLASVRQEMIDEINAFDQVILSTIRTNTVVKQGQSLAGTRVIPLIIEEETIRNIEVYAERYKRNDLSMIEVKPFHPLRVGMITTGSEVVKGLIPDKFGPIVQTKIEAWGSVIVDQKFVIDDQERIIQEIHAFIKQGVDLILVTGGMSVDPDDRTPGAIQQSGAQVVSYGTPMLPGSMLMIAYLGDVPIMGLPGCVMHDPFTSFDVLLARICAKERIVRQDIIEMGYGGFYHC